MCVFVKRCALVDRKYKLVLTLADLFERSLSLMQIVTPLNCRGKKAMFSEIIIEPNITSLYIYYTYIFIFYDAT